MAQTSALHSLHFYSAFSADLMGRVSPLVSYSDSGKSFSTGKLDWSRCEKELLTGNITLEYDTTPGISSTLRMQNFTHFPNWRTILFELRPHGIGHITLEQGPMHHLPVSFVISRNLAVSLLTIACVLERLSSNARIRTLVRINDLPELYRKLGCSVGPLKLSIRQIKSL